MKNRIYLRPISFLYSQVVDFKNSLYDRQWVPAYSANCKVLSVGNLTMGGTGKTPLVDFILKYFLKTGVRTAVVSRSYRAEVKEAHQVDEQIPRAAYYFGDEPVLLALKNPEVDFFVGPQKWQTARFALSQKSYDVLVVDDGFQHRRLKRDLDILVLDATEDLENYRPFPEGRGREDFHNIERAHLVVITKCNWVEAEQLTNLLQQLPKSLKVVLVDYKLPKLKWVFEDKEVLFENLPKTSTAYLVSAIGRPEIFEKQMSTHLKVLGASHFRDHHRYSLGDVDGILAEFERTGADFLLTTEKDAVKLRSFLSERVPFVVAPLEVSERGNPGVFDEVLSAVIC